jgi:large subunit ribosomal protein L5
MARLKERYEEVIKPVLTERHQYKNKFEIPKLEKIVLSMGVGSAVSDQKKAEVAFQELMLISGQKPIKTKARKSIATFKLREGMTIGVAVTLRKSRMYEFLDRLVNIALPRIKDFRGISHKSFDGNGNYSLGIKEQIIFPEIDYDKIDSVRGLNITFVTTAKSNEEAKSLLTEFNLPFMKQG